METIRYAVGTVQKRPFILSFFACVMLVYSIANNYNPITSLLLGFGALGGTNIFEGVISLFQFSSTFLSNSAILLLCLVLFLGGIIVLSLLSGLVFSSSFAVLNNTLDGKPKYKGDFISGLKKYFPRITLVSFKSLLVLCSLLVILMIATVPATIVTKGVFAGKAELVVAAILFIIVTTLVEFFSIMFSTIYIAYWFPSAILYKKGAFIAAMRITNTNFWNILFKFIIFDLIFVIIQTIGFSWHYMLQMQDQANLFSSIGLFLFSWLSKTAFFYIFIVYIFYSFKLYKEEAKKQEQEEVSEVSE